MKWHERLSLTELMIAIMTIGLLISIVIPGYLAARNKHLAASKTRIVEFNNQKHFIRSVIRHENGLYHFTNVDGKEFHVSGPITVEELDSDT